MRCSSWNANYLPAGVMKAKVASRNSSTEECHEPWERFMVCLWNMPSFAWNISREVFLS